MLPGTALGDGLADVKPFNSSIDGRIFHRDAAHVAGRRTLPEPRLEILQHANRASGVSFHPAIGYVANPAVDPQFPRDADGEIAVAYSLNLPGYPKFARSHRTWMVILPEFRVRSCNLPPARLSRTLKAMEVHLAPDVEKKLNELAEQSGRATDQLLQDALAGYLDELAQTRDVLNSRYDDLKSGRVQAIDGEEAFVRLKAKTQAQRNLRE